MGKRVQLEEGLPVMQRIRPVFLWWSIWVALGEGLFILWFRLNGSGRSGYGEAFTREPYIRAHLDSTCALNGGQPCTQAQLASVQHATTIDFWLDVRDRSAPFLLIALIILITWLIVVAIESRRVRGANAT